MSRNEEFQSTFRGLKVSADIDPNNAESVVSRLKTRPETERSSPDMHHWPIFGTHWSTDANVSQQFALNEANTEKSMRGRPVTRERYGLVVEARSSKPPRRGVSNDHDEKEVMPPHRDDIHEVLVHVHRRLPDSEYASSVERRKNRNNTHVATHVVPPDVWKNA
jgi:hypothetical protein